MSLVTPQYLLEGAFHALEQGGLLLRDANLLYESGSYANSKNSGDRSYCKVYERAP
jgi:hypothetical protein